MRKFASGAIAVALVVVIVGCTGPGVGSSPSGPATPANDLAGTWHGLFWWLGGTYWEDEGRLRLQIREDGTFTLTMTPTGAANNIAKAASWSGTVSQRGARVVFHVVKGPLPAWSSLARSGDTLYGVAKNPATGADIEIELERARGGA